MKVEGGILDFRTSPVISWNNIVFPIEEAVFQVDSVELAPFQRLHAENETDETTEAARHRF